MKSFKLSEFSPTQWEFLAVMEAFKEPVSIDVVGAISPLTPGDLLEIVQKGVQLDLIRQQKNNQVSLFPDLPGVVTEKLKKINNRARLDSLLNRLEKFRLVNKVPTSARANLLSAAGQKEPAAFLEEEIALEAIAAGELEKSLKHLFLCLDWISSRLGSDKTDTLYVTAALKLSDIHFMLGRGFKDPMPILSTAEQIADSLGDKRSQALISFNIGLALWFSGQQIKAIKRMEMGRQIVKILGDQDIISQAATYLGTYYYILGKLKPAAEYYELATRDIEAEGNRWPIHPIAPIGLSTCLSYLNQFYRGIGHLEYQWLRAKDENLNSLAAIFRAGLGSILLRVDQMPRALDHLNNAIEEARLQQNLFAQYLARSGLAFYYFKQDRYEEARQMLNSILNEPSEQGAGFRYLTPIQLEMLSKLEQLGKEPIAGFKFSQWFPTMMKDPSRHLKGTALRLRAERTPKTRVNSDQVIKDLQRSEQLLKKSGDRYELAKTRALLAKQMYAEGYTEEARNLANKARKGLTGHGERYFPNTLRVLIETEDEPVFGKASLTRFQEQIIKTIEGAYLPPDIEAGYIAAISALNRFLGAERGGLFCSESGNDRDLVLKASYSLSRHDVDLPNFKSSLDLIRKCFRQNRPLKKEHHNFKQDAIGSQILSLICLPMVVRNSVYGVLYYDNSYNQNCFFDIGEEHLKWLAGQLSLFLELALHVNRLIEDTKKSVLEGPGSQRAYEKDEIILRSANMSALLAKIDRVARSESAALILGETGVGKELFAKRLHKMSSRCEGPFVAFYPGSVPENLVESELFGHEKGAFTGADRRRYGLIELAHKGTLFIDELSEFPQNIQIKLLRVLQEKTFRRIGSNRVRTSDFRLVTASNRDMEAEVAAGRFRADLIYRLNTITLRIPPLRDRKEDIIALAAYFLNKYPRRDYQPHPRLSSRTKSILKNYHWPGNVRELKNVIEQALILSDGQYLELNLPNKPEHSSRQPFNDMPSLDEVQRRYIQYVLGKTNGRISGPDGAAAIMGIKRTTLYNRMQKLGMKKQSI